MNDRTKRRIVIYCGFLLSLSAISVDITLPMFPLLAADFQMPIESMQVTVTFYIVMLGIGQLLFGPLSDRFGRKNALFVGLFLFLAGTTVCALAGTLQHFLGGRILQGIGGASAPVIARAMMRDLFNGRELARNMAIATGIFSIGPIVGPLIGMALVELFGSWRAAIAGLLVHTVLLLLVLLRLPETAKIQQHSALKLKTLWANGLRVTAHPQSRYFMGLNGLMMTSMILLIALAPVVYARDFNVTGFQFAFLFALHGFGIILGQMINHRLIGKIGVVRTAMVATIITLLAACAIVVFAVNGWLSAYLLTFLIFVFAIGFLSVTSNAISLTMEPHGEIAGFASSLQGASTQVIAGGLAGLLAVLMGTSTVGWAVSLFIITVLVLFLLYGWLNGSYAQANPEKKGI